MTDQGDRAKNCGTSPHGRGWRSRNRGIDVVLVTGLSGAGRGTAAKVLEDLGWYVADNLPPELIAQMVDLGLAAGSRITQLAVVLDVRVTRVHRRLDWVRNDLATRAISPRVLFLEASDDILVRRYEQVRRSHPLQGDQTLAEGIAAERSDAGPAAGSGRSDHRHLDAVGARACGKASSGRSAGRPWRTPASPWSRSASSTGCRWTPTW